jgi:RAD51-like protein 2
MVVMDSVAFHFRHGASSVDFAKRARLLSAMSQKLNELANKQALAVVLLNQMTTKVGSGNGSRLVPALGESWAHAATHRVQLYWAPSLNNASNSGSSDVAGTYANVDRAASLIKSSCRPSDVVARYTVTELGVRDVRRPRRPPAAAPGGDAEEKRVRHNTPTS